MWIYYITGATILGGLSVVIQKLALHSLHPEVVALFRSAFIFITISLFIAFQGKVPLSSFHLDHKQIFYIILIGILSSAVLLLYLYALKDGRASVVGSIDNLTFVFTALFAVLFIGEHLSLTAVLGMALILSGVFLIGM